MFLCSRSSSRPPYYPREADSPPRHVREVPRVEHHESKCTNICSRRGESQAEWKYLGRIHWFQSHYSSMFTPSLCVDWTDRFSAVYRPLFSQLKHRVTWLFGKGESWTLVDSPHATDHSDLPSNKRVDPQGMLLTGHLIYLVPASQIVASFCFIKLYM